MDKNNENILINLIRDLENLEHTFRVDIERGFNIFTVAGLVRQEIRHSRILSYLLNPSENHGLGDQLSKQIISLATRESQGEGIPNALKVALADFGDLVVLTEKGYDKKRLDLIAYSPSNKLVIAIENKLDSSEGKMQLESYFKFINNDSQFTDYSKLFVYLTLDGDSPSQSNWVPLGYRDIADLLTDILEKNINNIDAEKKLFINHYIDLIRKHVMDELKQELRDACMDIYRRHKAAIDLINKNLPSPITDAQEKFLIEHKDQLVRFEYNKRKFGFLPKRLLNIVPEFEGTEWFGQKRPIVIWFSFSDNKIGIIVEVGPMEDGIKRSNFVQALHQEIRGVSKNKITGTYSRIWTSYSPVKLEDLNEDEIKDKMNDLFKKIDEDLIKKIEVASTKTFGK